MELTQNFKACFNENQKKSKQLHQKLKKMYKYQKKKKKKNIRHRTLIIRDINSDTSDNLNKPEGSSISKRRIADYNLHATQKETGPGL